MAELPLLLADLHLSLPVDTEIKLRLNPDADPDWNRQRALDLVIGAGFTAAGPLRAGKKGFSMPAKRIQSLPDTVTKGMRLLVVGSVTADRATVSGPQRLKRDWSVSTGIRDMPCWNMVWV